jgi:hypothetical protein
MPAQISQKKKKVADPIETDSSAEAGSYPVQRFAIFASSRQCEGACEKLHSYPGAKHCTFALSTLLTRGA